MTIVHLSSFHKAMQVLSLDMDEDEVECVISNLIYQVMNKEPCICVLCAPGLVCCTVSAAVAVVDMIFTDSEITTKSSSLVFLTLLFSGLHQGIHFSR